MVNQGEALAKKGQIEETIAKFQKSQNLDSNLNFKPTSQAKQIFALVTLEQGQQSAGKGQIIAAIKKYQEAQDAELKISGQSYYILCLFDSIQKQANQVMPYCEKSVELDSSNRDVRALARALTGNIQGAIEDYQFMIEQLDLEEMKQQRRIWIEALQK